MLQQSLEALFGSSSRAREHDDDEDDHPPSSLDSAGTSGLPSATILINASPIPKLTQQYVVLDSQVVKSSGPRAFLVHHDDGCDHWLVEAAVDGRVMHLWLQSQVAKARAAGVLSPPFPCASRPPPRPLPQRQPSAMVAGPARCRRLMVLRSPAPSSIARCCLV